MVPNVVLRERIISSCLSLVKKGLIQGTGGNVSVRTERGFLITPSGMDYEKLVPEDIVEMDFDGNVIDGNRTPSIERLMHLTILKARPDVNAVIHTHSIHATAVAAARRGIRPITDNQVAAFGGPIPVAKYAPIGTEQLALNVAKALGTGNGVLLANHGVVCTGANLSDALLRCEMAESFAKIFILSQAVGGGIELSQGDVETESADLKNRYGQK
ncbi:MAG: class II aldolase/adducin family protein [Synergistaceae bacterium]|nr:class II aldolase/adducin family protein [Synergistaceae bacterium]